MLAAVGNQRSDPFVNRDAQRPHLQPFEPRIVARPDFFRRIARQQIRPADDHAHHRHRQRFVIRAVEFGQHRHAADYAVGVRIEAEVSRACRALLQLEKIRGKAGERRKGDVLAGERAGGQHRRRQYALLAAFAFEPRKRVAQHHRPVAHVAGENLVVLELGRQLLQRGLKPGNVFQFFLRELLQHLQARTLVALGKHDVEADDRNLVMVEQLVEQRGQAVARPRPAALAAFSFSARLFSSISRTTMRGSTVRGIVSASRVS